MVKDNGTDKTQETKHNVNINLDTTPVLYTDNIFLNINNDGVVMDVAQRVGNSNQLRVVARVGMSREHAKKIVEKLGKLLVISEGKSQTGENNVN